MKQSSESQKEAVRPIPLLTPRKPTRIATWNIRTMYELGRTAQIAKEMKTYNISVLGLSETRWLQAGQLRLTSGETLLYSGHTEDGATHTEGVALMLSSEARCALIGWEPVSSRIITAKFATNKKKIQLYIIQCYAPTNESKEEEKDDFYHQLQTVLDRRREKDIIVGDLNAKIGNDNMGYEDVMGVHGLGQMNENGERFADLCSLNQLVIGGSIFPHKRIHKTTWRSPDHITENQIDHICINRKFRRSWRDVRVMRGADVSSDHHLVLMKMRLRLKKYTTQTTTRTKYNVRLLRNREVQTAFQISLYNRLQPLQEILEDTEVDLRRQWQVTKRTWLDTCEEVLGKSKIKQKEWISTETLQKVEERKRKKTALNMSRNRAAKVKAQEDYTAADKEVKTSVKRDKRDYINDLANQAEEAAGKGNQRDLYAVTRRLAGKFQQTDKPVKDKKGNPLTTTEGQLKRWAEHFSELLNQPPPESPPDIPPAKTELPIDCDKPSKAEIKKAIMLLKNGKAVGPDDIPAEAIKVDIGTVVNMLHSLFSKIWEEERVPAEWKEGILIKLPKKGDLSSCNNYRGIMMLSVPGKVLNRVLLERMKEAVDAKLRDQQAGFRRYRSCIDQIASLRIIVEQSLEWNSPLYNFIDYEKAFDSVDRQTLWKLLRHYGVPKKFISLIKCTYQDMTCRVAHAGQMSDSFEVRTGVRQGCLLSPFLFLLVIDWIMKMTTAGRKNGIQWTPWTQLEDLDFADDLALLSHNHNQMQDKTTRPATTSARTGLVINRRETELMKINTTVSTPVTVGGEPIQEVESFVYLGSIVDTQGGTDRDVTAILQHLSEAHPQNQVARQDQ
ncbi:endonuclease-reverse transcriptase [Labeo rohita]|uniref:Endonuclease-reverse transcriptase n=1 Tax=Labeo rohita TaxID=84645 RepID=A0A498LZT2_LABRO|nr:endonuclease-reverse transcriptase [Labeo rohita]